MGCLRSIGAASGGPRPAGPLGKAGVAARCGSRQTRNPTFRLGGRAGLVPVTGALEPVHGPRRQGGGGIVARPAEAAPVRLPVSSSR